MKHHDKTQGAIAIFLWSIVVLLLVMLVVTILESAALVHGQEASGWYVRAIRTISSIPFSLVSQP